MQPRRSKSLQQGGKVVVNYVSKDQAAELVAEECRALGGEALCKGDVSDDAACQQLVQTATEHFGGLNCLINNAGTTKFNAHEHLAGLTDDDFYRIYGVNVVGPYQMVRAAESGTTHCQRVRCSQRRLDCRSQRSWVLNRLCGFKRRVDHDDAVACSGHGPKRV